jgi:aspartate carbamoyltransferase (EC 2.1.3.2)
MMPTEHVLSASALTRGDIEEVLAAARAIAASPANHQDRLRNHLLGLLFFEPSTRTRMSFAAAMQRLGGDVIDMGSVDASSVQKGESLADTVRVIEGYVDAIVLRHPSEGAARVASEFVDVPIINAGDGAGQHPTQTLLDLYTIEEAVGLEDIAVGIVGDLKYGRTVHSLAAALSQFDVTQHFIAPPSLRLPDHVRYDLDGAGVQVHEHTDIDACLQELDVLYMTRIQRERFPDEAEYRAVAGAYRISAADLEMAQEHLAVLHPLPRVDEIAADVDATPHAWYFQQSANGIPVRMALLERVMEVQG